MLSIQYFNGTSYQQFGLTTADIKTSNYDNVVSLLSMKDSTDNLYSLIGTTTTSGGDNKPKIIKIDKNGNKTITTILGLSYWAALIDNDIQFILSRDNKLIIKLRTAYANFALYEIAISSIISGDVTLTPISLIPISGKFAIYQDRYIWVASSTTVKIYDYNTKAELASVSVGLTSVDMDLACSNSNELYIQGYDSGARPIIKLVFNGVSTITSSIVVADTGAIYYKQLLLDKYNDLIILTNSGTASTLLKYTTAGVQVGTTLDLGGAFYNLNTDKDGNYYYSNALGTYKITANTAQGQAFTSAGTKIRGSGMVTYGNNITNFNPAVFGAQ